MNGKPLGNLLNRSKSLADFAGSVRDGRSKLFDFAIDKALERVLPEGIPDDLQGMIKDLIKDQGKFLLVWLEASILASPAGQTFRASSAAKKLSDLSNRMPTIQRALRSLAANGLFEPARRMLLVAEANRIDLESSAMRIVDDQLTPYQAKTQCLWAGTFAEFRTGSIVTGAADPRGHFAIYFPGERRQLHGSFHVTRISCEFQDRLQ